MVYLEIYKDFFNISKITENNPWTHGEYINVTNNIL